MSDPIEQLNRLGDALEGAPMPLPATEIRARGERIRRRKHAAIAGVSAAVLAAVAIPVGLSLGGDDSAGPPIDDRPSVSDPVPSAPLSAENLLTEEDAGQAYGGAGAWVAYNVFRGDGQDVYHPCATTSFAGLGAKPVFRREFNLGPAAPAPGYLTAIAGEFPTEAAAQAAYDDLSASLVTCTDAQLSGHDYQVDSEEDVPLTVGDEAHRILAGYVPDGTRGFIEEVETGIVRSGSRLEVIFSALGAQDYVEQMSTILPRAAQRLVLGGGAGIDTPGPTGAWPTTIPQDFPLSSGWNIDPSADDYSYDPPSADLESLTDGGELEACGTSPVDPGAVDRLTTRLNYVDDGTARELLLLPSDQEAVTYVAQLRALYEGCPTEGRTPTKVTTDVADGALGEESLVVTRSGAGVFRSVATVVRVGNAVVVDQAYDEGGPEVASLVTETQENLGDVMAALNDLEGAGTPGDPGDHDPSDPMAPAAATTIPDGFPLDLALGDPPVADGETRVDGPSASTPGAKPETACGVALAFPNAGSPDPDHELGYAVTSIEGYDGRTIRAYPTAQDAVDQMDLLRSQVQGCSRDSGGDGLSDRIWRTFNADTGYDTLTFGWYYEATEFQGATAGALYTVSRVGNAVLVLDWTGEYSADTQRDQAPDQVELAQRIGDQMDCDFSADGC